VTERRFSEDDFAAVLQKATELQSRALVRTDSADAEAGMSLEEVKAIAAEVGINPDLVERAAGLIEQDRAGAKGALAANYLLSDAVPGDALGDEDRVRILQAIQDAAQHHGKVELGGPGLEWNSARGEPTQINVSVQSLDGKNHVRVSVDRSGSAVLTHVFPTLGGFFTAMITGAILEPESAIAIVSLIAGGVTAGFTVARTIWTVNSRKLRAKTMRILRGAVAALPKGGESALGAERGPPASLGSGEDPGDEA
jgi:hypothetical protein